MLKRDMFNIHFKYICLQQMYTNIPWHQHLNNVPSGISFSEKRLILMQIVSYPKCDKDNDNKQQFTVLQQLTTLITVLYVTLTYIPEYCLFILFPFKDILLNDNT